MKLRFGISILANESGDITSSDILSDKSDDAEDINNLTIYILILGDILK